VKSAAWPEERRALSASPKTILAYADGSCIGNPGPGGWGVVIVDPDGTRQELGGAHRETTNNRMELTAAIEALRRIERGGKVVLRSDSEYVVKGINENRKRNKNLDLWDQLDAEIAPRHVRFEWVRGHADDPLNARTDELARSEAERIAHGGAAAHDLPKRHAPKHRGDDDMVRELQPMLRDDETIRTCAGCGRAFVSKRATYCSLAECQLKARRAPKAD